MREKETEQLLDEIEPEIVRNLDPIYQRLLEIWKKARTRQEAMGMERARKAPLPSGKDRRRAEP